MDDKRLLKLLAAGLEEMAAAKQLDVTIEAVSKRVLEYLEAGVLRPSGERDAVDWKAFGEWKKRVEKKALEAA